MLYRKLVILGLFLAGVISWSAAGCKNPFKPDEKKKERVIILVDDYLAETGRLVVYWDGKNEKDKYISPGKYIILMEVKDFQDQDFVTAKEGGKLYDNNYRVPFEPGFWASFELEPPDPDPFFIRAGVNVPFLVSEPARVKITIFKD